MSAPTLRRLLAADRVSRICLAIYALAFVVVALAELDPDGTAAAWSLSLADPLLAALTVAVLIWGRRRLDRGRERGFWDLLALAWLCRLLVEGLYFSGAALPFVSPPFATDLLYVLLYLNFALAIELRPHLELEPSPTLTRRRLEGFAGLMAVFGLLTYFALVVLPPPSGLSLSFVSPERGLLPYLLMRASLDVFLLGRALFTALGCRGRWRAIYLLLAAALFLFTARDALLLFEASGILGAGRLSLVRSAFLFLPGLLVILASRCRRLPSAPPAGETAADSAEALAREDMLRASPLALYMLVVPVLHLLLYSLALLDDASRAARDVFCLAYLLVVGFIAARHQKVLEAERRLALDSLETEVEQRERINRELELRQTEMEQFTYTISHELRAPLVTIHGFTSLLEREVDADNETGTGHLARIRKATSDMSRLLVELLELSRVGWVLERKPGVSLSRLAEKVCTRLAIELGDHKAPHIWIDRDMPPVEADEPRIEDLLTNLVTNAIKFTPEGKRPRVYIGWRRGDPVVFFVSDRGRGIPAESQDKVFGLFNRLDHPEIEGTGVGLALVKRIVENHGGRIWVESEGLGTGTTVCFTIPPRGGG